MKNMDNIYFRCKIDISVWEWLSKYNAKFPRNILYHLADKNITLEQFKWVISHGAFIDGYIINILKKNKNTEILKWIGPFSSMNYILKNENDINVNDMNIMI